MYRSLREGNGVGSVPKSGVTETRNGDVHCATSSASLSCSISDSLLQAIGNSRAAPDTISARFCSIGNRIGKAGALPIYARYRIGRIESYRYDIVKYRADTIIGADICIVCIIISCGLANSSTDLNHHCTEHPAVRANTPLTVLVTALGSMIPYVPQDFDDLEQASSFIHSHSSTQFTSSYNLYDSNLEPTSATAVITAVINVTTDVVQIQDNGNDLEEEGGNYFRATATATATAAMTVTTTATAMAATAARPVAAMVAATAAATATTTQPRKRDRPKGSKDKELRKRRQKATGGGGDTTATGS
ncbi:hypothetical protein V8E54_014699 [Elaphomyces granulatus]